MRIDQLVTGIIGIGIILFLYFLPTIFGFQRGKRNRAAIFALNLFTGWTFVGWVVCLIWALTKDTPIEVTVHYPPQGPRQY